MKLIDPLTAAGPTSPMQYREGNEERATARGGRNPAGNGGKTGARRSSH